MGRRAVQQQAESSVEMLAQHGHAHAATALQTARQQLDDEQPRMSALEAIQPQCHIQWLGDVPVPSLSWSVWWGMLDTLNTAAKRERASLQKSV